jgi:hypothetical protein
MRTVTTIGLDIISPSRRSAGRDEGTPRTKELSEMRGYC